jgi:hypothetical protein
VTIRVDMERVFRKYENWRTRDRVRQLNRAVSRLHINSPISYTSMACP